MCDTHDKPVNVYKTILDWSDSLQAWQRDAIRRIVVSGDISNLDHDELETLCLIENGLEQSTEGSPTATVLASEHITETEVASEGTSLISLSECKHVNALPDDQTLEFGASPGLTVIYGNNGSGKSGYARVLKKACRARGQEPPIKANVNKDPPKETASALIRFVSKGKEHDQPFVDGEPTCDALGNILVFDSASADAYVRRDGPTDFTPSGLDVLPKLARTCDATRSRLQKRIKTLDEKLKQYAEFWQPWKPSQTKAWLESINAETQVESINKAANFLEENGVRLKILLEILSEDPRKKAATLRADIDRLRRLLTLAKNHLPVLSHEAIEALATLTLNADAGAKAAEVAKDTNFNEGYLSGTGNAVWRRLWDAARAFSLGHAYPNQEFPAVGEGMACVLCQAPLGGDARERLSAFDKFVKDRTQQDADELSGRLKQAIAALAGLKELNDAFRQAESSLIDLPEADAHVLTTFLLACRRRWRHAMRIARGKPVDSLPAIPGSPEEALNRLIGSLTERAKDANNAFNPEKRAELEAEVAELQARKWVHENVAGMCGYLVLMTSKALLEVAFSKASTNLITIKSGELFKAVVTNALRLRFEEETKALGLKSVSVELVELGGKKGGKEFGARLKGSGVAVHDVASEGERRCIALASFFAALSHASHSSSLLFDDPVCSLDHQYRKRVAARLVREAKYRQVVVFTHDVVFLTDLMDGSTEESVPCVCRYLSRVGKTPGMVRDGLPWRLQKTSERLDHLEKSCRAFDKEVAGLDDEARRDRSKDLCDKFRVCCEVAIEQVLLNSTVVRYRDYIDTKHLSAVAAVTMADCDKIKQLFDWASDWVSGHAESAVRAGDVPTGVEILAKIDELKAVVTNVKNQRKAGGN